jgi:hypothetical protein
MSPRPEEYRESMFNHVRRMELFDVIRTGWVMKDLVHTKLNVVPVPGENILFDHREHKVSQALLIRKRALPDFIELVENKKLLPQSQQEKTYFEFWQKYFGIIISKDDKKDVVTISRDVQGNTKTISWSNESGGGEFLSDESRIAITALSLVPDSSWGDVSEKGFLIGTLKGDIYNHPWNVRGMGVVYKDNNNVLQYGYEPGVGILKDAHDWDFESAFTIVSGTIHFTREVVKQRKIFLATNDVFGIFADMRTMK